MAPLMVCGFGIVFVVLQITVRDVDLVPDTIGLVLYAAGLWRLAASSRVLVAASTIAGIAALLALSFFAPDWLHGAAEDTRDVTYGLAVAAALGLGAAGLGGRARSAEDAGAARQLTVVAGIQVVVAATVVVGYAINSSDHDRAVGIIGSGAVLEVLTMTWFAVLLVMCANRPWAQPDRDPDGVPHEHPTGNGPEMRETPGSRS